MPPHKHHHHHGGHHHSGGGRPWWGPGYGPQWDPTPNAQLVVVDDGDRERERRIMAHIMALPQAQRAAAYHKFFGHAPGPGALGDLVGALTSPLVLVAAGVAVWWWMKKRKR